MRPRRSHSACSCFTVTQLVLEGFSLFAKRFANELGLPSDKLHFGLLFDVANGSRASPFGPGSGASRGACASLVSIGQGRLTIPDAFATCGCCALRLQNHDTYHMCVTSVAYSCHSRVMYVAFMIPVCVIPVAVLWLVPGRSSAVCSEKTSLRFGFWQTNREIDSVSGRPLTPENHHTPRNCVASAKLLILNNLALLVCCYRLY